MAVDEKLINQIIENVLAQMRSSNGLSSGEMSACQHDTILIDDAVITEATLESRINNQQNITIGAQSILTPTGRDLLNSRNISWSRADSQAEVVSEHAGWNIIYTSATSSLTAALRQFLKKQPGHRQELADDSADAASRVISSICRSNDQGVIVFSGQGEVVSCLANRNSKVRAAVVRDAAEIREVNQHLGGNVYCINPKGRSSYEIQNLLNKITQS